MKIICVDDEQLILKLVVRMCKQLPQINEAVGFSNPHEALEYLKENDVDIVLLDIEMPKMNGITLAVKIKELCPDISIIFLTGYQQYALDAFRIHASGYIMKPIEKQNLEAEIDYVIHSKEKPKYPHVFAKTFGGFEFFVDGKPMRFERSKAKELLAFLIDRQGAGVKRKEAFAALYEDTPYDRKRQKSFNVIVSSLRDSLNEYGIGDIFEINSGELRINPDLIECDLYRLLSGDVKAINSYRGEYMTSYPWASLSEGFVDKFINK